MIRKFILSALSAACLGGFSAAANAAPPIPSGQNVIPTCGAQGPNNNGIVPSGTYYNAGTKTTGWALTFAHCQTYMMIQAAGTLATGTLTTETNPLDGQRECFASNQIQTALTWAPNTGQTLATTADPPAALGAPVCQIFVAATATWYPSP